VLRLSLKAAFSPDHTIHDQVQHCDPIAAVAIRQIITIRCLPKLFADQLPIALWSAGALVDKADYS